ncbi:MAG: 6-bladed beta-propeller [Balneolaceae bacterium]|nr:6-bladed beta-propeller [Balneolaceae bacterium]
MKFLYLPVFTILFLLSCKTASEEIPLGELPLFTPGIIQEIESLGDDIFFSHIAYRTIPLEDEAVFLPDRNLDKIFKVSSDGNLISIISSDGRGPGEIHDITFISRSFDNNIIVYDQMNKKVLRFSASGEFLDEFILQPWEKGGIFEVYELDETHLLTVYRSIAYLSNPDAEPEAYFVIYDKEAERYIQSVTMSDRPFARIIVNDQIRGGRTVPYAPEHVRYFNHRNSSFYTFWTEEATIVSLSESLDTTRTISFELSREPLSRDEINEIRDDSGDDLWRSMRPLLPEYKAIANSMIIDDQNNFWLKLNHRSEYQQWLILSEAGEKLAIVQLPKDGLLTHVSDYHLGFRLDDHLFALFEPIEL